ncbi:NAD(P)-dependent oxidoreductase [Leifsonia shinshuensis]|uniref:NAD(P)-dependent oxidoreductase n=1 Tax=Leifsonia shinshuensis TaxID=150026 RepID=UPI002860EDF8|nr:NAD(P)-dependent oxidoreductase [Leifsonia shinshuensis]MDR6972765.1 3-hydroxyisobutyrate dehydrogenase-like beta-hydroxyacid dehydrogenase [Leifsonia shinshuensis]
MTISTISTITTVGFIGLGDQGAPMARALADSRFALRVWARRAASLDTLRPGSFTADASPAQLAAASDIVLLVLRDDADVDDILDRQGLLAAMRPGAIIVNHGTGDPQAAARFAQHAGERGITMLDAPVSGGGPGAERRELATIVGGDRLAFERALPVFETFSSSVVHMGGPGSGQVAKLLNNALTMTNLKNAEDVLSMAAAIGVDIAAFRSLLATSSGGSFVMQALGDQITPEIAPHLQGLMRKDIEHFADAVGRLGVDVSTVRDRGLAGAEGLEEASQLVWAALDDRSSLTNG